jgi:hypothetical protein
MLGATSTHDLSRLVRIEGQGHLTAKNFFDDGRWLTYDGNLCVWRGFACGTNVEVPAHLEACAAQVSDGDGGRWRFIDTQVCGPDYAAAPRVFVAIYRACPSSSDCAQNTGFLEVLPASTSDQLSTFQAGILQANPAPAQGLYHSASGHDLAWGYSLAGLIPAEMVTAVDGAPQPGPSDWPFLSGEFLTGDGAGRVTIVNPAGGVLSLDLSDRDHPSRRVH